MQQKTYKPIEILGKWVYHTANGNKYPQDQEKRRGTDMDWNVMVQYLPQYEKAAWLTLRLGVAGIFWAILVGLVCAVLQYEKVPVLRRIVGAYSSSAGTRRCWSSCSFCITACPRSASRPTPSSAALQALPFWAAATWPRPSAAGWKPLNPSRQKVP